MFEGLYKLIESLKGDVNHEKLEAGVYSQCRDARAILQSIKQECGVLRKAIMENHYDKKKEKKASKSK